MKITKISLSNYRNFKSFEIPLGNKVTIFIGRNGMGKTNLIAGMVQSLSFIFSKQSKTKQYDFIASSGQGVKRFLGSDPRYEDLNYNYPIRIKGEALLSKDSSNLSWSFEQESEKSGLKDSMFREAYHVFWEYYNLHNEKPVLAYFSDGFPHKETKISNKMNEKLDSGNPLPANTGYYQWDFEQSCAEIWKIYYAQEWFNIASDDTKKEYVDSINNVFRSFSAPLHDDRNVDIMIDELYGKVINQRPALMVHFANGKQTQFDMMPAGYVRMFSIVLDLANRSYLLNRHCNPEGIVFIDEIDLHLHPSLASEMLPRLQRTFPNLQFIVSTHSPMVITNFDQNAGQANDYRLYQLYKSDDGYSYRTIQDIYGLDYNSSLTNIMETPINIKYSDNLIQAYTYWKTRDNNKADRIANLIKEKYSSNKSLIDKLGL